ncbi:MAG: carbohydrate kinase [Chloroflexi bacterium]|nr:carbohydrate kinase [Chloroflexota bacterium]
MGVERLASLLSRLPDIAIGVVGDFFLDRYLVIDRALSEISLETGLEVYQVVEKRSSPGAAGTVTSNLRALGVGTVYAVGLIGDDGEGYELRQGLRQTGVSPNYLISRSDCYTPTYTKPMVREPDGPDGLGGPGGPHRNEHEIQRIDVKNRRPLTAAVEDEIIQRLEECVAKVDGLMVSDQVQERNFGVITDRIRARLAQLAGTYPEKVFSVDSRTRIGEYRNLLLKPNRVEAAKAIDPRWEGPVDRAMARECGVELARRARRPACVTMGEDGILVCEVDPRTGEETVTHVPGVPVSGAIDPVGAGDSAAAGIVSTLCAGASVEEAALVGNLVASITVQQIGTTGTASPAQLLARLQSSRASE